MCANRAHCKGELQTALSNSHANFLSPTGMTVSPAQESGVPSLSFLVSPKPTPAAKARCTNRALDKFSKHVVTAFSFASAKLQNSQLRVALKVSSLAWTGPRTPGETVPARPTVKNTTEIKLRPTLLVAGPVGTPFHTPLTAITYKFIRFGGSLVPNPINSQGLVASMAPNPINS